MADFETECRDCGAIIRITQDWKGRWVILETDWPDYPQFSYFEPALNRFVQCVRHTCYPINDWSPEPKPPPQPRQLELFP